jgi:hypothetical protein
MTKTDGWMDGRMDEWMDGWMDGWIDRLAIGFGASQPYAPRLC